MEQSYRLTPLEQYIYELYRGLDIHEPADLNMEYIADKLNVWLHTVETASCALERHGMLSIILDGRLSREQQWEDFGHELCHLLRHGGNQLAMSREFIRFQEAKADLFALHFCVPTFMLLSIDCLSETREAALLIAQTFRVTPQFARERLHHFTRQAFASRLQDEWETNTVKQEAQFRASGIEYMIRTGGSTMLYNRNRGVVGYMKEGTAYAE
ncbi:ImmA/IrrE family metallo-endopeptidase [Paenibacillus thalictri]|uniref:ImmA/IrrE family metallo-endopeptidase n=1 Tax=Paenibacillus thalictri TaxID=2527873 RepID=A0A4Q9DGJ4_9BACL|nr:ImmA/IrrE family metallo-endopeptidase [Paenibacillus thalictri]TBL71354.1 ImmA/IrrE family metallo-endopeptidase [Paenibacillus thalictri]